MVTNPERQVLKRNSKLDSKPDSKPYSNPDSKLDSRPNNAILMWFLDSEPEIRRFSKVKWSPASTGGCSLSARTSARPATGWSVGCLGSNWRTGAVTATPRPASGRHSTRRSASSKGS